MEENKLESNVDKVKRRAYLFEKDIILNYRESVSIFHDFLNQFKENELKIVKYGHLPDYDSIQFGPTDNDKPSSNGVISLDVTYDTGTFWVDMHNVIDYSNNNVSGFISKLINIHRYVDPLKTFQAIYDDEMNFFSNLHEKMYKENIRIIKPIQTELLFQIRQLQKEEIADNSRSVNPKKDIKLENQLSYNFADFYDIERIKNDLVELEQRKNCSRYITKREGLTTFKKLTHLSAYLHLNHSLVLGKEHLPDFGYQLATIFKLKVNQSSPDPFQILRKPYDIVGSTLDFFKL